MDNMRKRIEERKQEAKDKGFTTKACLIASTLGSTVDANKDEGAGGFVAPPLSMGSYSGTDFSIETRESSWAAGSFAEIRYKGASVFCDDWNRISAFIPGAWETAFEALYNQALNAHSTRVAAWKASRDAEVAHIQAVEANRFGL